MRPLWQTVLTPNLDHGGGSGHFAGLQVHNIEEALLAPR